MYMLKRIVLLLIFILFQVAFGAQKELVLMSYNVNLLPNIPISDLTKNLNHPYKRSELIAEEIGKINPDVVTFQEDIAPLSFAILNVNMKDKGYRYRTKVVGSWDWRHPNLLNGGVVIYSKYPFFGQPDYLIYPSSLGWEAVSNKGAVYVAIKKEARLYHIVATHTQSLDSDTSSADYQIQFQRWKMQINALSQFVANLRLDSHDRVILLGDFNADSGKAEPRSMAVPEFGSAYDYLISNLKAREAAPYTADTRAYSYDSKTNKMAAVSGQERTTLDHVLCLADYRCPETSISTIDIMALKSVKLGETSDLSDHYAVLANLYYP
ncbi:MAG: sphingomyelin phosphodiesterase [Francisellaceae bacterium]